MADILIVEDDPAVMEVLRLVLQLEGHTTRAAANGVEALDRLREQRPDLTISDIEMPFLDGPGMANRMRVEDHGLERIPIVLISGFPEIRRSANEVGTPYFIEKPFEVEALLALVRRALEERILPLPYAGGRDGTASAA